MVGSASAAWSKLRIESTGQQGKQYLQYHESLDHNEASQQTFISEQSIKLEPEFSIS